MEKRALVSFFVVQAPCITKGARRCCHSRGGVWEEAERRGSVVCGIVRASILT